MYSASGTAIMVAADEACLIAKSITDGIDQGCPIGNLIYGLVVSWTITRKVRARFDPILVKFIIDDLSTAAPVYHPLRPYESHHGSALYYIIELLLSLRQKVEGTKCAIAQSPHISVSRYSIRADAVRALYPPDWELLKPDEAYRLAGGAVGTKLGKFLYLSKLADKY